MLISTCTYNNSQPSALKAVPLSYISIVKAVEDKARCNEMFPMIKLTEINSIRIRPTHYIMVLIENR